MDKHIEKICNISRDNFIYQYISKNRPVVIIDALSELELEVKWSPEYFINHFGDETVQIYNDYFTLTNFDTLRSYIEDYFGKDHVQPYCDVPYVRWYSRMRDVDFIWADDVLEKMQPNWKTPEFIPTTGLLLPYAPKPIICDPGDNLFPARGLFISGKGARTGLHVDPWGSDAFLCQMYGQKTWRMYSPDQAPLLTADGSVVDPDNVDAKKFSRFSESNPDYIFTVGPGDIVYVPHGWFHIVTSDTDCISFTWNFVHDTNEAALRDWLKKEQPDTDMEIVRYFLGGAAGTRQYMS